MIKLIRASNLKQAFHFSFYRILIILICVFICQIVGCKIFDGVHSQPIYDDFKNPPQCYLPTVYWFWNGTIEKDQIKWQLEEMKRSNTVGSVCILAWEGLSMEYLSDEWFDKVKYACQIAQELGLDIWLYDEIRWPSGHAGGKVLESNPELKAKCLSQTEMQVKDNQKISIRVNSEPIAIIAGRLKNQIIDESSLIDVTSCFNGKKFSWNAPEEDWLIFIYSIEQCTFKPMFLNQEYVNLLDADVVQKFIGLTHEGYYKRMPEYFGSVIKAIITDEPGCYCNLKAFMINPETIAWTPSFFEAFRSRKNYDLKKYLPALWHDIGKKTAQIRVDFYDVISDLLQVSFFKPLHDWCESHHIKLNIQPAHEETMKYSTLMQGDYFKSMEYSNLPGCDEVYSWDKYRITPKLASSAAHCFGKQDVYCEVFGAYGWDVTLAKMKAVTDWLYSRGVNRLLLSSFYFAKEANWQFEIPPSLFYQNTLWKYLPNYAEYVQRLSYLLSGGRNGTRIAVLYPTKSVQAVLSPLDEKIADQIDSSFIRLSNFLLEHQLDFDYLDEKTLKKVEIKQVDGKALLRLNQKNFWIDYEALILPHTNVMDESTLQKVMDFCDRGGKIIAYGNLPQISPEGADLKSAVYKIWRDPAGSNVNYKGGKAFFIKSDFDSIQTIIESCLVPDFRLEPPNKNINYIHKIIDDLDIYFIANNDSLPVNTRIFFSQVGIPQIWNAEDGTIANAAQFQQERDRTILQLQLDSYGSSLILFDQNATDVPHVVKSNMNIERIKVKGDSLVLYAIPMVDGENFVLISWKGEKIETRFFANPPEKVELPDCWNFKPEDNSFPEENRSSGSWTEQENIEGSNSSTTAPAHPYFSGTGIYSQKFCLEKSLIKESRKFILKAGQVNDIIEIWLNGKKVGERCWQPFSFDITDYLNEGDNLIELMITNTPANNYMLKPQQYRLGEKWGKILKSGLTEKVTIEIYERFELSFVN